MRFDSKMPMVEDVCRLQWLDARTCPIVSVALVRVHLPWWQQLIHRFHVWQRNECYLQIIITMSMHRADNVIYRNKCKINSKIEKRAFLLLLWPNWGSCLGLQMSPSWTDWGDQLIYFFGQYLNFPFFKKPSFISCLIDEDHCNKL